MPTVDETLAQLSGARVFSKVDANSGFWQIPLSPESQSLTTFITPFGRYCFQKLPFGIASAPELFQRRMNQLLNGLSGVLCHMDDVLIFGRSKKEHDSRLLAVLSRLASVGVTLNRSKCVFSQNSVKFLGHEIDECGVGADPEKVKAITNIDKPKNTKELRRFLGMVNQLGKFTPRLAELSQPLRQLLSTKQAWFWGPDQEDSFSHVKEELTRPVTLDLYDPQKAIKVSADASSYGLGAVLLQKSENVWKPVAFASRSMSATEQRYAQIEKEALAVTWSCEKFTHYILGRHFSIESDHKPLIPLLSTKNLDNLPPRILRFRLRMAKYSYTICHVPGKQLYTADTLSRAPLPLTAGEADELHEEVETFINGLVQSWPVTEQRLDTCRKAQADDDVLSQVRTYCSSGWPSLKPRLDSLIPVWRVKDSLTISKELLLYNDRIVVPCMLQRDVLNRIHQGHQGIVKSRLRAKSSVWWPGMSKQITQMVRQCQVCEREARPATEPLMSTPLPDYPWQVVGSDFMELKGHRYLIVMDYYSRYPEVIGLQSTTAEHVVRAFQTIFARHGIPEVLRSDNGPQYQSQAMEELAETYGFIHLTSSPRYPRSNGLAERSVQTIKGMFKRSDDPYLALLAYRTTPLPWCGLSPSQLLMGRKLRTTVPTTTKQLTPKWSYTDKFRQADKTLKDKQKHDFDKRHRVQELPELATGTQVWIGPADAKRRGRVLGKAETPRSYIVQTDKKDCRRNRSHLTPIPGSDSPNEDQPSRQERKQHRMTTRSQTGVTMRPPQRLDL